MPQFDLLFFSVINILVLLFYMYVFLIVFTYVFNGVFKIKNFEENSTYQKSLALSVKNEDIMLKKLRILWIKRKILEFHDK